MVITRYPMFLNEYFIAIHQTNYLYSHYIT